MMLLKSTLTSREEEPQPTSSIGPFTCERSRQLSPDALRHRRTHVLLACVQVNANDGAVLSSA